jgi:hypothetical protein
MALFSPTSAKLDVFVLNDGWLQCYFVSLAFELAVNHCLPTDNTVMLFQIFRKSSSCKSMLISVIFVLMFDFQLSCSNV